MEFLSINNRSPVSGFWDRLELYTDPYCVGTEVYSFFGWYMQKLTGKASLKTQLADVPLTLYQLDSELSVWSKLSCITNGRLTSVCSSPLFLAIASFLSFSVLDSCRDYIFLTTSLLVTSSSLRALKPIKLCVVPSAPSLNSRLMQAAASPLGWPGDIFQHDTCSTKCASP